jgi:hypothetical protein
MEETILLGNIKIDNIIKNDGITLIGETVYLGSEMLSPVII